MLVTFVVFLPLSLLLSFLSLEIGVFLDPIMLTVLVVYSALSASESFVGEREEKTLEILLASPLTSSALVAGKLIASAVRALPHIGGGFFAWIAARCVVCIKVEGNLIPSVQLLSFLVYTFLFIAILATVLIVNVGISLASSSHSQALARSLLCDIIMFVFLLAVFWALAFLFWNLRLAMVALTSATVGVVAFVITVATVDREKLVLGI
jgi:ABC-type Na+ efflux pump permease subunit